MSQTGYDKLLAPLSEDDHVQGLVSAPVVIVKYGDYQSSQCGEAHHLIKLMQQRLENPLCLVFRHFPQSQIHPYAQRAAEAVEAASAQGQFWQMHNLLFEHQHALDDSYLVEYADDLGLDIPQFLRDMSEHVYVNRIYSNLRSGWANGITSAPTLFINSIRYRGAWDLESLLNATSS